MNQMPIGDLLAKHILPNISTLHIIFVDYVDRVIKDSLVGPLVHRLIDFASKREFVMIPIRDKRSIHKTVGMQSVVLFSTLPNASLIDLGIQPSEQLLFYLAHELGHCLMHTHYQSEHKTNQKQVEEYILFNELMAWHVASDLLLEHCSGFNSMQLFKQQVFSLQEYQRDCSTQKNLKQCFL
jgi:hypothetical protein